MIVFTCFFILYYKIKLSHMKGLVYMPKIIEIKNLKIGEGLPKICVPLVGHNNESLLKEAKIIQKLEADLVEWRIDYHLDALSPNLVLEALHLLRSALPNLPILATFRTQQEGGMQKISKTAYLSLIEALITSNQIDLIDIELYTGDQEVIELIKLAHQYDIKIILSNHDFSKTPSKEEIISRLCKMQTLGADLPKIAVMPQNAQDVLTLLDATYEMYTHHATVPIITMSMSKLGAISRLSGELFGSAITFGSAQLSSAPGQIPVDKLSTFLDMLHLS